MVIAGERHFGSRDEPRAEGDPSYLSAVALSVLGHLLLASIVVLSGIWANHHHKSAPPAYVVGLVSPAAGSTVLGIGPLAKAAVKAKPVPKPVAKAAVKPKPVPKPVAKAAVKPKAPPKPAAEPVAEKAPGKAAAVNEKPGAKPVPAGKDAGLVGAGGSGDGPQGGQAKGIVYMRYFNAMMDEIRAHWAWNGNPDPGLAATVGFNILPDGRVASVHLVERSGNPYYDQSVLNAVRATEQLDPPPPAHRRDFAKVEIVFRPQ